MTEIEQKALALVNQEWADRNVNNIPFSCLPTAIHKLVLLRAIEQHEAFRQEVSDAVKAVRHFGISTARLFQFDIIMSRFIITKPDPLLDVMSDLGWDSDVATDYAKDLRAALEVRGLEIREKGQ